MTINRASYKAARQETEDQIATNPRAIMEDINSIFSPYNLPQHTLDSLTTHLSTSPHLTDFIMQFQHMSEAPAESRALTSALTIAMGYFFGGLLPLLPYFFVGEKEVYEGLYISIGVMVIALFTFGYVKTCVVTGWDGGKRVRKGCKEGVVMVVVGSVAAASAMALVKVFSGEGDGVGI